MGGLCSSRSSAPHPAHRIVLIPPQVPLVSHGGAAGGSAVGARGARAAPAPALKRRRRRDSCAGTQGCSEGAATPPQAGVTAADVTSSEATGAADEPACADQRPGASGVAGGRRRAVAQRSRNAAPGRRGGLVRVAANEIRPPSPTTGRAAHSGVDSCLQAIIEPGSWWPTCVRDLDFEQCFAIRRDAEALSAGNECDVDSFDILELACDSGCAACDCESVTLARRLWVPLLTMTNGFARRSCDSRSRLPANSCATRNS
jgi:hypothetical protein